MPRAVARFTGREAFSGDVGLAIFDTHLEVHLEGSPPEVRVQLPYEELGQVSVQEVLGDPTLIIEDDAEILVAAIRLEAADADKAQALITWRAGRPRTRVELHEETRKQAG
jgi:hypothetical protein